MNESLLLKLQNLKSAIENDERVLNLKKIEKEMNDSEEVQVLAYKKDMMAISFEDCLKHYGENSNETREAQKSLYEAKLALDEHTLVKKYNEAYKEVRILYNKINKELFEDFSKKNRGDLND